MANGKEQMANGKPFEFCSLPFELALLKGAAPPAPLPHSKN
jgi:hypothetical protein